VEEGGTTCISEGRALNKEAAQVWDEVNTVPKLTCKLCQHFGGTSQPDKYRTEAVSMQETGESL